MSGECYIQHLEDNLLCMLLSNLPGKHFASASQVCKRWQEVITGECSDEKIWAHLYDRDFDSYQPDTPSKNYLPMREAGCSRQDYANMTLVENLVEPVWTRVFPANARTTVTARQGSGSCGFRETMLVYGGWTSGWGQTITNDLNILKIKKAEVIEEETQEGDSKAASAGPGTEGGGSGEGAACGASEGAIQGRSDESDTGCEVEATSEGNACNKMEDEAAADDGGKGCGGEAETARPDEEDQEKKTEETGATEKVASFQYELSWHKVDCVGDLPPPSYGPTLTAMTHPKYGDCLAVFGGVLYGGYQGPINELRVLVLKEDSDEAGANEKGQLHKGDAQERSGTIGSKIQPPKGSGPEKCGQMDETWTWLNPDQSSSIQGGHLGSARAYHTATWIPPSLGNFGGEYGKFLLFGGFANYSPVDKLEMLEVTKQGAWHWSSVTAMGQPPCHRFGHTAHLIGPRNSRYMVVGGCTGGHNHKGGSTDGQELQDVHILTLEGDIAVWSTPDISGSPPPGSLARCHSGVVVGCNILFFAGGPSYNLSNDLVALNTRTMQWKTLQASGNLPQTRQSGCVVALNGSSEVLLYGGWRGNEMDDTHVLRLGALKEDVYRFGNSASDPAHEDDEEDMEEMDEDDFGAGGSHMFRLLSSLSQGGGLGLAALARMGYRIRVMNPGEDDMDDEMDEDEMEEEDEDDDDDADDGDPDVEGVELEEVDDDGEKTGCEAESND